MESEKITVLCLKEDERLKARKLYTSYFRDTGEKSVYLFEPVIVLGPESDIRAHIILPEAFHPDGKTGVNRYGTYFSLAENDALSAIQKALGLEEMPTGLHLDMKDEASPYPIDIGRIRVDSIAVASFTDHTFRIIKRKKLSTGR